MHLRLDQTHPLLSGKTVFLIHVGVALWRLAYSSYAPIGLFSEEAQYWLWSKYPDWAYYSKPPLIAWVNGMASGLWGDSVLTIRANAALTGLLTALGVYALTRRLYDDRRVAFLASMALLAMPVYWLAATFFTTDSLLLPAWVFTLYFAYSLKAEPDRAVYALGLGVSLMLALLAKPTAALLVGWLGWLALNSPKKRVGRLYWLAIAGGIFTGLLPLLYWNSQHDWVTIRHLLHLAGEGNGTPSAPIRWDKLGEYIIGQVAGFSPLLWVILLGGFRHYPARFGRERQLLFPVMAILGVFLLVSTRTRVEMNWTGPALLALLPLVGYITLQAGVSGVRRLKLAVVLSVGLVVGLLHAYTLPGRLLPLRADPLARLVGQKALTDHLLARLRTTYPQPVLTDSYHLAAHLSFYGRDFLEPYCLNQGRRMNQFDVWQQDVRQLPACIWYVSEDPLSVQQLKDWGCMQRDVWEVPYRGEIVRTYYLYQLNHFRLPQEEQPDSY